MQTTILTLVLDGSSQARFDEQRQRFYPAAANRIAAHLTLFHQLPATAQIREALTMEAARMGSFSLGVTGVRSIGRGAAYFFESPELHALHRRLAAGFADHLSRQDRQGFRPHVVVQNKVTSEQARKLLGQLGADFRPWQAQAAGLGWWDYMGGPWRWREGFAFGPTPDGGRQAATAVLL